jgi:YegS/Rv2252/BmrU family lipid kinase
VEGRILSVCEKENIECTIEFTQARGHATELAREAATRKMDAVFAVGGDGTVNETARALVHSGISMGILPKGSGNGLARHLGIPMSFGKSLELIGSHRFIDMDTLLVNGALSVNVSGIGFDGHVAGLFGKDGRRGLLGYTKLAVSEFFSYPEFEAEVVINGESIKRNSFIIALANGSQFGNNARIAPRASVTDGLAEICFVKKMNVTQLAGFLWKMFSGHLDQSGFAEMKQAREVTLHFSKPIAYHIDGEGMTPSQDFTVRVQPGSLRILVPK